MNPQDPQDPEAMRRMHGDADVQDAARRLFLKTCEYRYSYNFTWLGRPIIQYPEDLMALQEIVWATQPDLVVETGVAHGGSLIFYASLLAILGGERRVIGIDIDVRKHNRDAIEGHPLGRLIDLIEGPSTDPSTVGRVIAAAAAYRKILVVLDSMHTHDHVLAELRAYSPLVRAGGNLIVLDTVVEHMPKSFFPDRPWGPGNNPMTAVRSFLVEQDRFVLDERINNRLLLTVAPHGFLRCVRDS